MTSTRRLLVLLLTTLTLSVLGYGAGAALRPAAGPQAAPSVTEPVQVSDPGPAAPVVAPRPTRRPAPAPRPEPEPALRPGPRLLGPGDEGDEVARLQARLRQIAWFTAGVTGYYGEVTEAAVRGFQAKREVPVTGEVDRRTLDRLLAMTTEPTAAELVDEPVGNAPGALDARCLAGRVLCVDKSSRTLRWVVDGQVRRTVDVRLGGSGTPTREGLFRVESKSRDHVSSLYDTAMPYAMFFSRGQAVHYSPDFAAVGYAGASHGCVNVRDREAVAWLFDQVSVGDAVVVYWS